MKKTITALLLLLCLCLIVPLAASGEETEVNRSGVTATSGGILDDTRFPDLKFRQALAAEYGDDQYRVDLNSITDLNVSRYGISDMTGLEYIPNLRKLNISGNGIEKLNLKENAELISLTCEDTLLTFLSLAVNEKIEVVSVSGETLSELILPAKSSTLKRLWIADTAITSMDLSSYTALELFECTNTPLSELNVSGCTSLITLSLDKTRLTTLNVNSCAALDYFSCQEGTLTSLSISGLEFLDAVFCRDNPLTTLSINNCPALAEVHCPDCKLTSLTLSQCAGLELVDCANNQIKTLSISGCPVSTLYCQSNNLTKLPTDELSELFEMDCSGNNLASLDLSGCTGLIALNCSGNALLSLDLTACTGLQSVHCYDNSLLELKCGTCADLELLQAHDNSLTDLDIAGTALGGVKASEITTAQYGEALVKVWHGSEPGNPARWALTFDSTVNLYRGSELLHRTESTDYPQPTFFLPEDLTTLDEDAFLNITAVAIYIPENADEITGNPFEGSTVKYVYGKKNTTAETFAAAFGYIFVPID